MTRLHIALMAVLSVAFRFSEGVGRAANGEGSRRATGYERDSYWFRSGPKQATLSSTLHPSTMSLALWVTCLMGYGGKVATF